MTIDTSRRAFFRRAKAKITGTVIDEVDQRLRQQAVRWIRPPYAIDELEFNLSCTRCGACTDACAYNTIFPLPERYGLHVAGTPAMDLVDNACRSCSGWPCVDACVNGALTKLGRNASLDQPPVLARLVVDTERCLPYSGPECGACQVSCPVDGALVFTDNRPQIDHEKCTGCALCRLACIQDPAAINVYSLSATPD